MRNEQRLISRNLNVVFRKGVNVCTFVKAFEFHRMNKLKPIIGLVHTKTSPPSIPWKAYS